MISKRALICQPSKSGSSNNILYDRDEAGEYFQLYTSSFNDLFFIEIVQRRGYRGFGAINAPIRLYAQSRLAADLETSRL